jgi:hypothetical protein
MATHLVEGHHPVHPVIFVLSVVLGLAARTYSDTQTEKNVLYPTVIPACEHTKLPRGR